MTDKETRMDIKVSVIIPIYNTEKYLEECLESVLNQTLKEIEIIAVDDGSTDNSLSILGRYAEKYVNIVILTQSNQGAGPARNNGIRNAKGKYLIFMDPDDFYPSNDCLEALYNAAEENHVMMCGGIIMQDSYGTRSVWRRRTIRDFCRNHIVKAYDYPTYSGHSRYLFQTNMIRENNIYYPAYRRFQDPPFTVKAMACAKEFYGLDKEVYVYRVTYRRREYSLEVCIDILHGIRDVFRLAEENNFRRLYEEHLNNIMMEYMIPFYKYSFCGNEEIDRTIEEINEIVRTWIGSEENVILTKEKVYQWKKECLKEYELVRRILCNGGKKFFYGAGMKAHAFIEQYQKVMKNVIGVAVTWKQDTSEEYVGDLCVRQIEEYLPYKEDAIVIIITLPIFHMEIEQNLKTLGFQHILKLDMNKIDFAGELRKEDEYAQISEWKI